MWLADAGSVLAVLGAVEDWRDVCRAPSANGVPETFIATLGFGEDIVDGEDIVGRSQNPPEEDTSKPSGWSISLIHLQCTSISGSGFTESNNPLYGKRLRNRFSYVINLKGPSFIVNTACSASLVALHNAKTHLLMPQERSRD